MSDANYFWDVLMIVVIPQSSSNPFRRDDIAVFGVEGIPPCTHVRDDSTRNLFVEFAFIRASSVVHPELPHMMAGERSSDCT